MSMENLMSRMASGCAEELIIELLDSGIFMRLAKIHILISRVEDRSALCFQVYFSLCLSALNRLTAAVYTAAGTSHYLDEINFQLA